MMRSALEQMLSSTTSGLLAEEEPDQLEVGRHVFVKDLNRTAIGLDGLVGILIDVGMMVGNVALDPPGVEALVAAA